MTSSATTRTSSAGSAVLMPCQSETEMRLGLGLPGDQRSRVGVNSVGIVELLLSLNRPPTVDSTAHGIGRAAFCARPCRVVTGHPVVRGLVGKDANRAGRSVDPHGRTGWDSSGCVGDAGGARDAEFAADDHCMAAHRAHVDDDAGCDQEQRCPGRIGLRGDQDFAGLEVGDLLQSAYHSGRSASDTWRRRAALQDVARPGHLHLGLVTERQLREWNERLPACT